MIDLYGSEVGFHLNVDLLPVVLCFVCLTETISIIENLSKITDIVPEKLLSLFHINNLTELGIDYTKVQKCVDELFTIWQKYED